ncbi:DUF6691 family protein [Vibrio parahaemolyticus]|uniref:DUF6691 family protein n=1 Tax=Vibrio parahaemolyticus TaxID=670 RepID=UPI0023616EF5|nr:DUF6691 family protein [Vibrio parahaemolyticus]
MSIILSIVLGTLFGFALYRVGATHADKIIDMLTLRDLGLAKTIIAAIGLSSSLFFGGIALSIYDPSHMSIKGMYLGVIIGGLLLGFGWALSGMCPGTGVSNLGAGRKDAMFFVVGGLIGAWVFTLAYEWLATFGLFEPMLGGKVSLVSGDHNIWLAIVIGIAMITAAFALPKQIIKD